MRVDAANPHDQRLLYTMYIMWEKERRWRERCSAVLQAWEKFAFFRPISFSYNQIKKKIKVKQRNISRMAEASHVPACLELGVRYR